MVPWKDMSDPGKAWQDKKVFPDVLEVARLELYPNDLSLGT